MKRIGLLVGLLASAAVLAPVRAQDQMAESPYYPLKVGTTWTYRIASAPQGAPSVTMKVTKHEKAGDLPCARLETIVNGQVVANEYVSVSKDAVYRVSVQGFKVEPPMPLLKLPPCKGDRWKIDGKVGTDTLKGEASVTEDTVTVPAGKYEAVVATANLQAGPQKMETMNHFARGVGIVKMKVSVGGMEVVMELEKFEAGN
jgi:hypothetical protein